MKKFQVDVDQAQLDDLQQRLERARFPDQLQDAGWQYGTELGYLKELVKYWRTDFDWRTQEKLLNRYEQFTTPIDGSEVHFIHARSKHEAALPLVITHGWPGSVFEFHKIIGPLIDPEDPADAFHVICPSMPGYGYSAAPTKPGFDTRSVAETVAKLMSELGYEKYGAQGGDWGAVVTSWLGHLAADAVVGIHINMVVAGPPPGDKGEGLSEQERSGIEQGKLFRLAETGYQKIQGTKPQSLGYGLNDSPIGLAAWITEKFRSWSDCGGDIESVFTKDELLTNIMIYWTTQSITSSMRLYYESFHSLRFPQAAGKIEVPTACAIFPGEMMKPPRAWAEHQYNVTRWTRFERGGHFAALEQPDALVGDIRAFFRDLR